MFRYAPRFAMATIAAALFATAAHADGVPGLRGHDHTGITVPDIKQASDFFVNVLGCKEAMSFGPFADDKGDFMQQLLNVNPRAVIHQITLVRCGYGSNIELFQYSSPDQKNMTPKNSDIGGYHIAFYVDDIKAAKTISTARASRPSSVRSRSTRARPPARASSISSRRGACRWSSSPIRRGWPTSTARRPCCGRPKTRRSDADLSQTSWPVRSLRP